MTQPVSAKRLLSSTAVYTAGDLLTTALSGFVFIPLYLRYMTPADYGIYGTISVMINMVSVLMSIGLTSAVSRYYFVYADQGNVRRYLGSIWIVQSLFAIFLFTFILLLGSPIWRLVTPDIPFNPYVWFLALGGLLAFSSNLYSTWLRVQERPWGFVTIQLVGAGSFGLLVLMLLVLLRGGAAGVLAALVGSIAVRAVIAVVALGRKAEWTLDMPLISPSLAFGGWIVFGTFGQFLLNKSGLFFIQGYSGLSSVGIYNLGLQLGSVLTLLSMSFSKAWQPVVYASQSDFDASMAIRRISKVFVAVMAYSMLFLTILSHEILEIVARPEYFSASVIVRIVAYASFIYVIGTLNHSAILYKKRASLVQMTILVSVAFNLILNIALVPHFQRIGAAAALLLSYIVMIVMSYYLAQRSLYVDYDWKGLGMIAGIATVLVVGESVLVPAEVGFVHTSIRIAILVSYPVLLLVAGAWTREERQAAWKAARSEMQVRGLGGRAEG